MINAMKDYLPNVEHIIDARHIYANQRKKHKAHEWQKKFWAVAKASNKQDYNYYKDKLAQETTEGAKDIMRIESVHWERAFFQLVRIVNQWTPISLNPSIMLLLMQGFIQLFQCGRKSGK